MPDRFQPLPWNDGPQGGTPITSARGPRRWETAIDEVDNALDTVEDRVDAIEAQISQGGGQPGGSLVGPTANRPSPTTVGLQYYDTTLQKAIWADGTGWRDAAGTALTGSGSSNAPIMDDASVIAGGTIGSIVLTWSPVTSATHYVLYEDASPAGVSGATSLTTTTTTRSPSTARTYHYWVTAVVGGVESAISNKVEAILPFSTTGGGGGGTPVGTPATILNIGPGAGQNHFDVGVGYEDGRGHVNHTQSEIINGYAEVPYFYARESAVAAGIQVVHFQVFANGAPTSTATAQARSELREYKFDPGGSLILKADWNGAIGTHSMSGKSRITHLPSGGTKPWVCFAQIHDAPQDLVRLQIEAPSGDGTFSALKIVARMHNTGSSTEITTVMQSSYTLGDEISWKIETIAGATKVYLSNVQKASCTTNGTGNYYKAGCYNQFNTGSKGGYAATQYASVELRDLVVTHSS